jgi:hypothetical protein
MSYYHDWRNCIAENASDLFFISQFHLLTRKNNNFIYRTNILQISYYSNMVGLEVIDFNFFKKNNG